MTTFIPDNTIHHRLDTQGLICPEPVMMLHRVIRQASGGEVVEILATDPATTRDIPNFCRHLGHDLLTQETLAKKGDLPASSADVTIEAEEVSASLTLYRYLVKKKSV